MPPGFFLNPTLIQEIFLWRSNTGENLVVFEPIARACASIGSLLLPEDEKRAAEVTKVLQNWCASHEFESMLAEARKSKSSLSTELGRETLSRFSGSESFVAGVPIDQVLSAFSALIRADLRARESRSIARIDEIFLWQAQVKTLSLHDICLLILSALASKNIVGVFDCLLAIKDAPATLTQVDVKSLSADLSLHFTSGMRLFALGNYESAEHAYSLAIEKDPQSPSVYLAMSLLHIINGKYDAAQRLVDEAGLKADASHLESIRRVITYLDKKEVPEKWADDPISSAVHCFLLLKERDYAQVIAIAKKRLEEFPKDLLMQSLIFEATLLPVREQFYNDPPLPGALNSDVAAPLDEARIRLEILRTMSESTELNQIWCRAQINMAALALMQRDFRTSIAASSAVLSANDSCGEAKINLATASLATGDLPKAMQSLMAIPAEFKIVGMRLAAEAYYHACAFDSALDLWKRLLGEDHDRLWRLRMLCRMLEVYRLLRDTKNAQACVDALLTDFQHEPETIFALSYELWQMNKLDDAINGLTRAKTLAAPNMQKWLAWELGRVLFDADKTLAATDEYVSICDKSQDSVQAREFTVALFRAGLRPAAYERAKAIREAHGEAVPGITEVETDFLVRENRLQEAKDLLRSLSLMRPLSALNRMAVVRICAGLNQEEEALAELEELRKLELSDEMREEVERFAADIGLVISIKSKYGG